MKKLFAYAAIALGAGALIFTTHSNAKPGFGGSGFKAKPWAFSHHHHGAHLHHLAHMHRFGHHHHFADNLGVGFPGFFDWGYGYGYGAPYVEPVVIEVQAGDVTGSTPTRRLSLRGNAPRSPGCSTEDVTVPASRGGETTIHVIRC